MKLPALPDNNYYNCFHSNIYTCANYLGRELEMLFSTTLNFIYHPDAKTCGSSILQHYSKPSGEFPDCTNELMYKYNGIRITLMQDLSWDEFISLAKNEELNQRPVVLHFDTYFAPWNKLYNREHSSEFIIVIHIGEDAITLFDPYHKKDEIILSENELKNSLPKSINAWKFELNDRFAAPDEDTILGHIKNYYSLNDYTDRINKFAERVLNSFDYEAEVLAYKETEESPILKNLKQLSYFRLMHAEFLNKILSYINDENNKREILRAISMLKGSIQSWDKLRAVLIYKKIRNDFSSKNEWMYNKLNEIAGLEKETLSAYARLKTANKNN